MALYYHVRPYLKEVERIMRTNLRKQDRRIYGMLPPFLHRGGKRIRPALCLLSCSAVGGSYTDVLEPAAILELFHNFTLIHDDIEDGAQFRRGEPALHVAHGVPMALNSGDALYTLLWKKLVNLHVEPSKLVKIQKLYADAFKRVVDGQGTEIYWIKEGKFDVGEKEYFEMINGKTSALIGLACELGAVIGGGDEKQRKALRDYGEKVGTAFQIQDDVLNVTGEFEKYKKEIGGDIREGKRTLMVVHCLGKAGKADRERLTSVLSSDSVEQKDIDDVIRILEKCGSIAYAQKHARKLVEDAKSYLEPLPPSKDKEALLAVADYVVNRES
jgi:geranylgeranyl diphosphate synthase type I